MKLYLMQHGDAVPKEQDPDRPLSDKGTNEVQRVARFLDQAGVQVARLIHSGKTRARQTAELMAGLTSRGEPATSGYLNPNDPLAPMREQISQQTEDTLIVGHLPFVGRLVASLVTGDETINVVAFEPGSIVCLEQSDSGWSVAWMLRAELLK